MSPPREPSASRRPSRIEAFNSDESRQSEQAGRSATNLHAQLSAASLRSQRLRSHSHRSLPRASDEDQITSPSSPSSPIAFQPTRSNTSDGSSKSGSNDSSHGARSQDANAAGTALAQGLPPPPPIPASRPNEMRQINSSSSLARVNTPRSVRDLGRDFDRYYNPFATPTQSTVDLNSPLPRYNSNDGRDHIEIPSGAPAESSRRNSNPFSDEKQASKSFEIKEATSTAVPVVAMATSKNELVDDNDFEKTFFPYLDDRLGAPNAENQGYTFPLYWHEKEWDDDMHLPMVDDDIKLKPHWKDHFTKDNIISTFGLAFMIIGLLCVFVMLPVLSWTGFSIINYPDDHIPNSNGIPITWATVNASRTWPLLKNMRTGLIDPDTPKSAMNRTGVLGDKLNLVVSLDELLTRYAIDKVCSFPTNSMPETELSILVMTLIGSLLISGMARRETSSGMIRMLSRAGMEHLNFDLTHLATTDCSFDQACLTPGIISALKEESSKSRYLCLDQPVFTLYGQVSGHLATLVDRDT